MLAVGVVEELGPVLRELAASAVVVVAEPLALAPAELPIQAAAEAAAEITEVQASPVVLAALESLFYLYLRQTTRGQRLAHQP